MSPGRTRTASRGQGLWYAVAVALIRRPLMLLTLRDWRGTENLPISGGAVVVTNHISHADPFVVAQFLHDNGRAPRFLAKAVLFRLFFAGQLLRGARQIPVYRESADASQAYSAAVTAVRAGECVVIYPEATLTRDPDLWPMAGKTGAARIALETGAPVVPIGQWGAEQILAPYARTLRLLPRHTVHVWAGLPVDLDDLHGREVDAAVLEEATERIMAAITAIVEQIRGAQAPAVRYDPRRHDLPLTGDPERRRA